MGPFLTATHSQQTDGKRKWGKECVQHCDLILLLSSSVWNGIGLRVWLRPFVRYISLRQSDDWNFWCNIENQMDRLNWFIKFTFYPRFNSFLCQSVASFHIFIANLFESIRYFFHKKRFCLITSSLEETKTNKNDFCFGKIQLKVTPLLTQTTRFQPKTLYGTQKFH